MAFLQSLIYGAGWRVNDATGKPRTLYDYFNLAGEQPVPRRTFASVRRECNSYDQIGSRRVAELLLWVFAFGTAASIVHTAATGASPWKVLSSLLWAAVCVVGVLAYRRFIRCGPSAFARELIAHGHCAACGYPLAKEEHEVTTCSECGAAWRSDEIGVEPEPGATIHATSATPDLSSSRPPPP